MLISISMIVSMLAKVFKSELIMKNEFLKNLFDVSPIWFMARIFGFGFVIITYFDY